MSLNLSTVSLVGTLGEQSFLQFLLRERLIALSRQVCTAKSSRSMVGTLSEYCFSWVVMMLRGDFNRYIMYIVPWRHNQSEVTR